MTACPYVEVCYLPIRVCHTVWSTTFFFFYRGACLLIHQNKHKNIQGIFFSSVLTTTMPLKKFPLQQKTTQTTTTHNRSVFPLSDVMRLKPGDSFLIKIMTHPPPASCQVMWLKCIKLVSNTIWERFLGRIVWKVTAYNGPINLFAILQSFFIYLFMISLLVDYFASSICVYEKHAQ